MNSIQPSIVAKSQQELDDICSKFKGVSTMLHLDIADGKFAPNHSLDFRFRLPLGFTYSAHLMVYDYERWITKYLKKIDLFIVPVEAVKDMGACIAKMRKLRKKVAFALLPKTKVTAVQKYLKELDYALVLTVKPGFYGSPFQPAALQKIKELKRMNPKIKVIVDGHMNPETIPLAKKAGADYIICGSYLIESKDMRKAMGEVKGSLLLSQRE